MSSFYIVIALTYIYFFTQFFFTQKFYSSYNILFLYLSTLLIGIIVFCVSTPAERWQNIIYSSGFRYYTSLLHWIKSYYKSINEILITREKLSPTFAGKGFTYVSYYKDIFYRGIAWNEDIATAPSWLDHLLSWALILIPIFFVLLLTIML